MKEVVNLVVDLVVDPYALKKCLNEFGVTVDSFTDKTHQNELFDELDYSFKFN